MAGCTCYDNNNHGCLVKWSRSISTDSTALIIPTDRFVLEDIEDKVTLIIAAKASPRVLDDFVCLDDKEHQHLLRWAVENERLVGKREDGILKECSCGEDLYRIPKDLTRCILNGLEAWKEVYQKDIDELRYFTPRAATPLFEEPDLGIRFLLERAANRAAAVARAAWPTLVTSDNDESNSDNSDDDDDDGDDSSDYVPTPRPSPAKRMRTGGKALGKRAPPRVREARQAKRARYASELSGEEED
ncbi:hypothetical protein V5O48_013195 [Marasmius crinis-equi]|uniref:Uncharacterized protein n=1 Tax=Marasmius crinis-equi TaxID=585013 RepID=A0ABR3F0P6_9AGAR